MTARLPHSLFLLVFFLVTVALITTATATTADAESNARARIINGKPVAEGKYPWMVALLRAETRSNVDAQYCGGTVIAPLWILTAAHCVTSRSPEQINVGYGSVNLDEMSRLRVEEIIAHTDFTKNGYRDIALLRLAQPVPASIEPIKLADAGVDAAVGTRVSSIGWGATQYDSYFEIDFPIQLQEVGLEIGRTGICNAQNDSIRFLPQHEVCIVAPLRDRLVCKGDSGGPSVARNPETGDYYQISIVSWSTGTCDTHYATIQTRLSGLADWIERQIADEPRVDEAQNLPVRMFDYCTGKNCLFDASYAKDSASGKIKRYVWRTEDGGSLSGPDAVHFQHRFPRYGRHTVTLKLVYESGRVSTRNRTFYLKRESDSRATMPVTHQNIGFLDEGERSDWLFPYAGYGFYHSGGAIEMRIYSYIGGKNFDLELWNYNPTKGQFVRIARSAKPAVNERLRRNMKPGYYSFVVRKVNGSGSYFYDLKYRTNRRDVCYLQGYLSCRQPKR